MSEKKSAEIVQQFIRQNILTTLGRWWVEINNRQRSGNNDIDYILFDLPEQMPALPESRGLIRRRILGDPPLSVWELDQRLERIANDPRPKGVILYLRGFAMSLADLQSLRGSMLHLREQGKRVICFSQEYDLARYYVASAADEIIVQPGGNVFTVGLRQEAVFFKDALERIGIEVDSIAITPYKGAADSLTRNDISPEGREQLEWLLDSRFEQIVEGIAEGRGLSTEKVHEIIDSAPYLDTFAKGIGIVDALRREEELYTYLQTQHILTWEEADKILYLKLRRPHKKYIALLPIEGLMMPGESANPPGDLPIPLPVIEDGRVGDITVVRQVRALMQDDNLGGVVLYVNSGGGAANAAEAMRSALAELAAKVPLVVFMDGVAASGGYLVSTPAKYIMCQPGTITGSIGVILSKPIAGSLREKLSIRAVEFLRGKNADILSTTKPFSDEQREWLLQSIERTYDLFISHVAAGRGMDKEAVDQIGGGRVWTGKQALENGLVDELGSLRQAIKKTAELASLPEDTPVALITGKTQPLAPQVAEKVNPAAHLSYLDSNITAMLNGQPQLITPLVFMK